MYVALIIIFNGYKTHAVLSYIFCIANKFIFFTGAYTVLNVITKIIIYELFERIKNQFKFLFYLKYLNNSIITITIKLSLKIIIGRIKYLCVSHII